MHERIICIYFAPMKYINPVLLVALILGVFLINAVAKASTVADLPPVDSMSSDEQRQASAEWESVLDFLQASDRFAGPGARATSCRTTGMASFYGRELQGRRTASGQIFNAYGISAAHRSLPFGTQVRVTSLSTGRSVVVRINDRGPFVRGRIIDLSAGAARAIGLSLGKVRLECL